MYIIYMPKAVIRAVRQGCDFGAPDKSRDAKSL